MVARTRSAPKPKNSNRKRGGRATVKRPPALALIRDQLNQDAQTLPPVLVESAFLPATSESGRWVERELQFLRASSPPGDWVVSFVRAGMIGPHLPRVLRSALADVEHYYELERGARRAPDTDAAIRGTVGWIRFEAVAVNAGAIVWSVFTPNPADREMAGQVLGLVSEAARATEAIGGHRQAPVWLRGSPLACAVHVVASMPTPSNGWQESGIRLALGRLIDRSEVHVLVDAESEAPLANNPHLASGIEDRPRVLRIHNLAAATVAFIDALHVVDPTGRAPGRPAGSLTPGYLPERVLLECKQTFQPGIDPGFTAQRLVMDAGTPPSEITEDDELEDVRRALKTLGESGYMARRPGCTSVTWDLTDKGRAYKRAGD